MTTLALSPTPATPAPPVDPTVDRVADLLLRIERRPTSAPVLRPIADLLPADDGSGDVMVRATVFVDLVDGCGPQPFDLDEVLLAADALEADPPFTAARVWIAPALRRAEAAARLSAVTFARSLA